MTIQTKHTKDFPMLPLRDVVVYPQLVIPLFVGREKSISAIEKANNENSRIQQQQLGRSWDKQR